VQDWLTSIEIKYYESKVNLNWKNIIKSIKEVRFWYEHVLGTAEAYIIAVCCLQDPEGFVEEGGWKFLSMDQSDSEDEGGDEESEFEPTYALK
jgi:nucleosome binding factor SPN SPT16 subunit